MKKFFASYLQHYRNDKFSLVFNIILGIVTAILVGVFITHGFPFLYLIGYVMTDPISYLRIYWSEMRNKK